MELTEKNTEVRYAVCVNNEGYEMDLIPLKIYAVLPTSSKESELDLLRVIDETGEDYLYYADYFALVEMSDTGEENVRRTMLQKEPGRS
jgi:hypothetical protein